MTIENAIAAVNAAGFKVNNLFQIESGWQANLYGGENRYEFGKGDTAAAALAEAIKKVKIEPVLDLLE